MWFSKQKRRVYLDYASATMLDRAAADAMHDAEKFLGNPGAIHAEGVAAMASLTHSREKIASHLGIRSRELVFTSGLTEGNNLAILGFARALERTRRTLSGTHWIVSAIEHDSVLECFGEIERLGGTVSFARPETSGVFKPETIARLLTPETVFVSVGWANNEIGTIQPLAKIAQEIHAYEGAHDTTILFHSDAGQAPLYLPTLVHSLGVDLLSMSASKLYGPHGIGALYISNRTNLAKVILGGAQERGLRAGTENVALAAGFAAAFDSLVQERKEESLRLQEMRDTFARQIVARLPDAVINGNLAHALPHMLNISIPNIASEYAALSLDHEGFAVSTKSACREGEERQSHVVESLGADAWRSEHTLRFSLGRDTQEGDLVRCAQVLGRIVSQSSKDFRS